MLITISGAIGAGKDTLTDMMLEHFQTINQPAKLVKFADPLRDVAFALSFNPDNRDTKEFVHVHSFTANLLSDEIFKAFRHLDVFARRILAVKVWQKIMADHSLMGPSGVRIPNISCRQFMVLLGMEARGIRPDYFIFHMRQEMGQYDGVAICSDCRFPNELDTSDCHVHIERPGNPFAVESKDVSESHLDYLAQRADYAVSNNGTVSSLAEKAAALADTILIMG